MKHYWNKKTTRAGHGRDGGCNLYQGGTYGIHYQFPNRPDVDTSCHGEIRLQEELDVDILEFFSMADITNDDALQYIDVEVRRDEDNAIIFKGRIHRTDDIGGEWEIETDTLGFAPTFNNTKIRQKERAIMNIYRIRRTDEYDFPCVIEFICIAPDEKMARHIIPGCDDPVRLLGRDIDHPLGWIDFKHVNTLRVEWIGVANENYHKIQTFGIVHQG